MVRLPISPETIMLTADGRCTYYGIDVTDRPFWWRCPACNHEYQETLAVMMMLAEMEDSFCTACGK